MARAKLNISGTIFEFNISLLDNHKGGKLHHMCAEAEKASMPLEFIVDRSATCFEAILSYYQTGQLHFPQAVCPGAFQQEMQFWGLQFDDLHECCLFRYQEFLDGEETRRNFLKKTASQTAVSQLVKTTVPVQATQQQTFRTKLWNVIDNQEQSGRAKAYFAFISLTMLLSIFAMAYSTEPSMRRMVTNCELLEYMALSKNQYYEQLQDLLDNPDCKTEGLIGSSLDMPFEPDKWKDKMYFYEDGNGWHWPTASNQSSLHQTDNGHSVRIRRAIVAPPVNSISFPTPVNSTLFPTSSSVLTSVQTSASSSDNHTQSGNISHVHKKMDIPQVTVPKYAFTLIDLTTNAVFTVDFILRMFSCPNIRNYFKSTANLFDMFALFGVYLSIIITAHDRMYRYTRSALMSLLSFMQVFRFLRLLRVVENVRTSKVLTYSLLQNLRDLTLLFMLLFIGISTFACLFYYAESVENISSIPDACYWAVVTMTTVGFGDITPQTGLGRLIASVCSVCGILLIALTLPIFVNNFMALYHLSAVSDSIEMRKRDKLTRSVDGDCKTKNETDENDSKSTHKLVHVSPAAECNIDHFVKCK